MWWAKKIFLQALAPSLRLPPSPAGGGGKVGCVEKICVNLNSQGWFCCLYIFLGVRGASSKTIKTGLQWRQSWQYVPILNAELVVDVGGADGDGLVLHPAVLVPLLHSVPTTGSIMKRGALAAIVFSQKSTSVKPCVPCTVTSDRFMDYT